MGASYAYAVGNVRAREPALLTRSDMEQLLGVSDVAELLAALRDRGLGGAQPTDAASAGMEELFREETRELWRYLKEVSPDFSLYEAFLYRQDIHNCKAVIKGVLSGRAYRPLLLEPSSVPPEEIEKAVTEGAFELLPPFLREAAARAYEILAHAADAQLADAVLDRAGMAAMLEAAARARVPMLRELIAVQVFYANCKTALRAARAGKSAGYLEQALCPCPGLDIGALAAAASAGEKAVLAYMEELGVYGSGQAAERYRESPSSFEKFVDDRTMEVARKGRAVTLGPEPLLGYLVAKETQIKDLHILFSGLRAGQGEADIRGRLREPYPPNAARG